MLKVLVKNVAALTAVDSAVVMVAVAAAVAVAVAGNLFRRNALYIKYKLA